MTVFTPTKASGSHFYRYQSAERLDRLKPLVLEHKLYVPTVAQLNDPADCRPKLQPMSENEMLTFLKNAYVKEHPVIGLDDLQKHERTIRTGIQIYGVDSCLLQMSTILNTEMEHLRVYSLSKRFDNLSLWAKYAADHTGYCLEFANVGQLFGCHVFEVIYGEHARFDLTDPKSRSANFLVCKRSEWSNEEEVRLIATRDCSALVSIDPRWLTRIILGKNMSTENEGQVRQWAKQRDPELIVVNAYFDELRQEIRLKA